jgi:hypothetical protein
VVNSLKKLFVILFIFASLFLGLNISQAKHQLKGNFIILTIPSLLKEAMLFANYRSVEFNVSIITTDDIRSSKPEAIRSYLAQHFSSGYLLIIASEETIPRPLMYPSDTEHGISTSVPSATETDLYYAFLNTDIDKDNDGFAGELYDDRMQIHPDLIVGRIPFDDEETVREIFENTVKFENRPPNKAVLAASFIAFPGEIYDGAHIFNGDGARSMELIKSLLPVDTVTLYEKGGSYPSLYDCTLPLTKDNFLPFLTDASFVDWDAHGSSGSAYSETWVDKNENGIPDDGFNFSEFINKNDSFKASGIFFSGSCLNENGNDNLGKAVLKKGGVAFIGSTEISFTPSYFANPNDGGSSSINYYFVLNLVQGNTVGQSLYNSFSYFFDNLLYNDIEDPVEGSLMNIYDLNIYGDPALRWKFQQNKANLSTLHEPFSGTDLNVSVSDKTATISISSKSNNSFFIVLPKGFYIDDVSCKNAIIDRCFGLIRVNNFSGTLEVKGILRGTVRGDVILKDNLAQNSVPINASGYDILDFNFDGGVDFSDLKILLSTFGTTYKNEGFNELCDINFDHRIDGKDLFFFMFGKQKRGVQLPISSS